MKSKNWFIVPDVLPALTIGLVLTLALAFYIGPLGAAVPAVFVLFTLYFFRNPPRSALADPEDVLSPADGVVICIEKTREDRYFNGEAIRVSVFLNIFNVHVNRAPIAGRVEYTCYQPGQFLPAFKSHASAINERNYVGIRNEENPAWAVLVVQITGFIARRIVCWVKDGESLARGERFGLIKFGSCTDLYLPAGSDILVKKGQKVKGGESIIGRLRP